MGVGVGAVVQPQSIVTGVGAMLPNPSGAFLFPNTPNIADFLTFLATSVQSPATARPYSSPWPGYAFNQALLTVIRTPIAAGILYPLAVYNLATHILFAITPDVAGQNYFSLKRGTEAGGFGLVQPSTGVVVASSDQGTSSTLAQPKWASNITVGQLALMKTPWGREYLTYAQSAGPNVWGLT